MNKNQERIRQVLERIEQGLAILAPCFRKVEASKESENKFGYEDTQAEKETRRILSGFKVTYVYDIADTDGSDEYLPVLVKGLAGNSKKEQEIYENLKSFISLEHEVREVTGTKSKGSYNLETGVICVRADLEYLQKIKTLLHEYGHSIDFKLHPDPDMSRSRREVVAESVAFVVGLRLGLDTSSYSMGYIRSWLKDTSELKLIADTVQKVSAHIINNLAGSLDSAFSDLKEDEE